MKIKTIILEIGLTVRHLGEDRFIIIREWSIQGNGRMMKCMAEDRKNGLMELFLLVFFNMG